MGATDDAMDIATQEFSRTLRRRGALILGLFAALWAMVGASGLESGAMPTRLGSLVMTGLAVGAAMRPTPLFHERIRAQPIDWRRRVGVVNLVQFIVIAVIVTVFVWVEQPTLVPPLVCLVVGVHFFPLSKLFDQPEYRLLGAALFLLSVVGLVVLIAGGRAETSRLVVGFGAAILLWIFSFRLSFVGKADHIRESR